jgi:GNAT superfamily N-acetyltransferase
LPLVQHGQVSDERVRRAGPADAAALVTLEAAMFAAMGTDPGGPAAPWRPAAAAWFRQALAEPGRFAAFVVDDPGTGQLVSGAAAVCERRTPGPGNADGIAAHVFNVCSLPGFEGRGYARACVTAVLGWARDETAAGTVQLAATSAGIGIYRSLGFAESEYPVLRLAIPRVR